MNTTEEITNGLKARMDHPFVGAFITCFLIINWECWLYAFTGTVQPMDRITAIETVLKIHGLNSIWIPTASGLFFVFIVPWLGVLISNYNHWVNIRERVNEAKISELYDLTDGRLLELAAENVSQSVTYLSAAQKKLQDWQTNSDQELKRSLTDLVTEARNSLNGLNVNPIKRVNVFATNQSIKSKRQSK